MEKKFLLLFTDYYPYEKWEPYLEPEMEFLASSFEEIFIFSNYPGKQKFAYTLPPNAKAFYLSPKISFIQKMLGLRFLFSRMFREEIRWARTHYHIGITVSVIKTALSSLLLAKQYKWHIEKFLHRRNLKSHETIAYSYWMDYRALAGALLNRDGKLISISRAHGWDVYFERHTVPYLPFRKFISQHLSNVFFVSENGREYFLKKAGIDNVKGLHVSRLGIHQQAGNPPPENGIFVVVSCARLISLKRTHLVADILHHVNELPVKWIHFGSGKIEDAFLRHVHEQLHGKKNIQFDFRGDVSHEELMDFYRKHHVDLFILTSEYEGMPFVIVEALSFGIPVMATDVGGVSEVINQENGFLLEKFFDPQKAAEVLLGFSRVTEEKKNNYRSKAFDTWKNFFSAEKNYPAFINTVLKNYER